MKLSEFDYFLDPERIAQRPLPERDESRLMLVPRREGAATHRRMGELPDLLAAGDLLVLNDTRVLAARLFGSKTTGGRVELLLLERDGDDPHVWRTLLHSSRPPRIASFLEFDEDLRAEVLDRLPDYWLVRFERGRGTVSEALERVGRMPLPPYVKREPSRELDDRRYQTIYASNPGAVAAPTAGLHFTHRLLRRLERDGVEIAFVTLHVGPGTFLPVRVDDVERHRMHDERFVLPQACVEAISRTRRRGGRVVAVGTTVVRCLEHRAQGANAVRAGEGRCGLFIYPGFRFSVVDGLLTNFHLPRSTLLMLVCAFAGTERTLAAYAGAVEQRYRFYSYGDAMLIL